MPFSSSRPPAQDKAPVPSVALGARALWGMLALTVVTLGGLCFAWWYPEHTLWHFVVVTQMIPLFYLALAWWVARRPTEGSQHG